MRRLRRTLAILAFGALGALAAACNFLSTGEEGAFKSPVGVQMNSLPPGPTGRLGANEDTTRFSRLWSRADTARVRRDFNELQDRRRDGGDVAAKRWLDDLAPSRRDDLALAFFPVRRTSQFELGPAKSEPGDGSTTNASYRELTYSITAWNVFGSWLWTFYARRGWTYTGSAVSAYGPSFEWGTVNPAFINGWTYRGVTQHSDWYSAGRTYWGSLAQGKFEAHLWTDRIQFGASADPFIDSKQYGNGSYWFKADIR